MTRINLATNNGYIFVDGKLTAYTFESAIVNFATGEVEYNCLLGGKKSSFKVESCPEVFADENAYREGVTLPTYEYTYAKAIRGAFFYVSDRANEQAYYDAYLVENGKPELCVLPTNNFRYCDGKTEYLGEGKFYETRDIALLYCDIIKVDENGEETALPSPATKVALGDDQLQAVKAVCDAIRKANELGVNFCVDNCDDKMYAYSRREVKETTYDCICGRFICDYGYCINDLMTPVNADIVPFSMDDTGLYVQFK